jgi:hypothetical protein
MVAYHRHNIRLIDASLQLVKTGNWIRDAKEA